MSRHRSSWSLLLGAGILLAAPVVLAEPVPGKACKDDVSKKFTALYKACRPDAEKFCPGVEMGGGKLLQCLGDNEKSLSSSCKKVWGKPSSKKKTASAK